MLRYFYAFYDDLMFYNAIQYDKIWEMADGFKVITYEFMPVFVFTMLPNYTFWQQFHHRDLWITIMKAIGAITETLALAVLE